MKLEELTKQPTYLTISKIDNWEYYFAERKNILEEQLQRLQSLNLSNS